MFRPPYLQPGDSVALISPASIIEAEYIEYAVNLLCTWGLRPVVGKHATLQYGYFAGTDEQRAEDMQWAMDNEEIRAIFCTRGGYGCLRIVEKLDYSKLQGDPKWLVGFSDITVFHTKLNSLGIESMHAAMPKNFRTTHPDALLRLKNFLFGKISSYTIPSHPFNRDGFVRAELAGGNLSLLHCLHDSVVENRHQSAVLFIEDIGEQLYALDRMMQSLKLTGKFKKLQGLIVGNFINMQGELFGKTAYEIIKETIDEYDYPVCFGFPAGHAPENYPLIMGAKIDFTVNDERTEINFL